MDIFSPNPIINEESILSYISQEEIMHKYLEVDPNVEGMFCSPLRKDENPTCTFKWINGKLLFRDWAREKPLDCFGVVMEIYNLSYNDAQKKIADDFDLKECIKSGKPKRKVTFNNSFDKSKSKIKVKVQPFTKENIAYLKSYYLNSSIASKFNVFSPEYVWLNGRLMYRQHEDNPALAYYFGKDEEGNQKWKIYFYRDDKRRFMTNTNRINGWVQLPDESDVLIITKALKDVMCLDLFDIPAVAMQAESQMPYDYIINELENRFDKIITLFDYDEAGIRRATSIYDEYDIPYYFIQDSKAKDFSDYIKEYGIDKAKILTNEILSL